MAQSSSSSAVAEPPPAAPPDRRVPPVTNRPAPETPPPAKKRRGPVFWIIALAVLIGCGVWVFNFLTHAYYYESTDDAYVTGHVHQISPRVAGAVTEVLADDNQSVKAGQLLAKIDPLEYEIALHKSQANLAQAKAQQAQGQAAVAQATAQLTQLQAQVGQSEAEVNRMAAQFDMARINQERNNRLYAADTRAISKADVDQSKSAYDAGEAALNAAKANLAGAASNVTAAQAQIEAAKAQVEAAKGNVAASEATVRDAERELSYTALAAPVDGRIGNKNVEMGNRVQVGQAVYALVQPNLWIVANFKETQLAHMQAGQTVEFTIDAIPGQDFTGKVDSIAPATGAQFALLPPDNATGNFTKVVQRLPVKIVLDKASIHGFEDRIRPGLSTVINVRVR